MVTSQQRLFLHHPTTNLGDPKKAQQHQFQLLMDQGPPTRFTYDTNFDDANFDPYRGLRLPAGTPAYFNFQNVETVTRTVTTEPATVQLAVGTDATMAGGTDEFEVTVELQRYVSGGQGSVTTIGSKASGLLTSTNELSIVQLSNIALTETAIAPNEYLRLKVTCVATSGADCHLHYDNATTPSYTLVYFQ